MQETNAVSAPSAAHSSAPSHVAQTMYTVTMGETPTAPPTPLYQQNWVPAGLAFFGVIITLLTKWHIDKGKQRLRAKEKIYLKVVDALHDSGIAVATLSNPSIPSDQTMTSLPVLLKPLNQAEVLAGMPLMSALAKLRDSTYTTAFKLLELRLEVDKCNMDININAPYEQHLNAQIQMNLEEQRQINLSGGHPDPGRFQRLQQDFQQLQARQSDYFQEDKKNRAEALRVGADLATMAMQAGIDLVSLHADVLLQMRKELKPLGSKFSVEQYLSIRGTSASISVDALERINKATHRIFGMDVSQSDQPQPNTSVSSQNDQSMGKPKANNGDES